MAKKAAGSAQAGPDGTAGPVRESKAQIAKFLNKYYVDEVRMIYELVSELLLRNPDFLFALEEYDEGQDGQSIYKGYNGYEAPEDYEGEEGDDILSSVTITTGRRPDFGYSDILSPEEMAVLREFESLEDQGLARRAQSGRRSRGGKGIKKAKMVELLSEVFSSDTLLEGFFLLLDGTNQSSDRKIEDHPGGMDGFAEALGIPGRWQILSKDPVYRNRRDYNRLLIRYVSAGLGLYGCLYVREMLDLIEGYEPQWGGEPGKAYTRAGGGYRYTLAFSPEWLCVVTLREFADCCVPFAGCTLDGLLVNGIFLSDLLREMELFYGLVGELGHLPDEEEMNAFSEQHWDEIPYRVLYETAAEKEMYIPKTKEEFLQFEDDHVVTPAERKMRRFLQERYSDELEAYAEELTAEFRDLDREEFSDDAFGESSEDASEDAPFGSSGGWPFDDENDDGDIGDGIPEDEDIGDELFGDEADDEDAVTAEDALDMFMDRLCEITDNGPDFMDRNPTDAIESFQELMEDYGMVFRSEKDMKTGIGLLMEIMNNTRLWTNHGYTPTELARRQPPLQPGQRPTIVPGSSMAAQMLSEGRSQIEKMGFRLDLEQSADEVSVFSMPQGFDGPVQSTVKKIYPNDPCPCGSGRKYKKCCGRNV